MGDYYILKDHEPIRVEGVEEWARQFEIMDRHVEQTMIGDVRVSTVFLGINHNFGRGPPLLFETMIFGGVHDGWQERCSTWVEAEAQHVSACAAVQGGLH